MTEFKHHAEFWTSGKGTLNAGATFLARTVLPSRISCGCSGGQIAYQGQPFVDELNDYATSLGLGGEGKRYDQHGVFQVRSGPHNRRPVITMSDKRCFRRFLPSIGTAPAPGYDLQTPRIFTSPAHGHSLIDPSSSTDYHCRKVPPQRCYYQSSASSVLHHVPRQSSAYGGLQSIRLIILQHVHDNDNIKTLWLFLYPLLISEQDRKLLLCHSAS